MEATLPKERIGEKDFAYLSEATTGKEFYRRWEEVVPNKAIYRSDLKRLVEMEQDKFSNVLSTDQSQFDCGDKELSELIIGHTHCYSVANDLIVFGDGEDVALNIDLGSMLDRNYCGLPKPDSKGLRKKKEEINRKLKNRQALTMSEIESLSLSEAVDW